MAITTCRECSREVSTEAASCPHCGIPNPAKEGVPLREGSSYAGSAGRDSTNRTAYIVVAAAVVIAIFLFLGNFRIVSGAGVVSRQYFGFDDMFASVGDCTTAPWLVASAQHGKLCSDLQAAGILESDAAMEDRTRREILDEAEKIQEELMRDLR